MLATRSCKYLRTGEINTEVLGIRNARDTIPIRPTINQVSCLQNA